ncbi:hypothetical protein Noda2021_06930 [Candidatus Dependentiae bacterium Noda2021]|nr:hypothetical protein Noda2021_06930 [Candidatus Dependentiae bacterium Noda2021]
MIHYFAIFLLICSAAEAKLCSLKTKKHLKANTLVVGGSAAVTQKLLVCGSLILPNLTFTGLTGAITGSGTPGARGAQGSTGNTGATGPDGATGLTGFTGPNGPTGATGLTGLTGSQGPLGVTGAPGTASLIQSQVITAATSNGNVAAPFFTFNNLYGTGETLITRTLNVGSQVTFEYLLPDTTNAELRSVVHLIIPTGSPATAGLIRLQLNVLRIVPNAVNTFQVGTTTTADILITPSLSGPQHIAVSITNPILVGLGLENRAARVDRIASTVPAQEFAGPVYLASFEVVTQQQPNS